MEDLHSNWDSVLSRRVWRGLWIQEIAEWAELLWSERQVFGIRKRSVALFLGVTILLHLLLIWLLLRGGATAVTVPQVAAGDLMVTVLSSSTSSPMPAPVLQSPAAVAITEPQVEIGGAPQSNASSAVGIPQILAPRPDPRHANLAPMVADAAKGLQVVLRILVGPSGDVDDAQVAQSCGRSEIDVLAAAFVKAHWKFLPAMEGGGAVPFWTTVLVPLASL